MLDAVPGYVQIIIIFFGVVTAAFGIFKAGVENGAKKNGFVTTGVCEKSVNKITKTIELLRTDTKTSDDALHEKINETGRVVSRVEGYLQRMESEG